MNDVVLTVGEVVAVMEELYPPSVAAEWDAVGLIAGDPTAPVRRVLFAIDPVLPVADEAIAMSADLIITHHPLFLRGVHSVAADTYKGALVHRLIQNGVALYNAHTNADSAPRGVAAALTDLLGIVHQRPLVPESSLAVTDGEGAAVVADGVANGANYGIGRIGDLPETVTLAELAATLATRLPKTAQGVRVAGNLAGEVRRVAVVGGSGDSLFDAVRSASADVYVTADLRHHPASELRERAIFEGSGKPYLLDVAHFASEWPWLVYAAEDLAAASATAIATRGGEGRIECQISTLRTDPWDAVFGRDFQER